jgi:stress-induced morphogen
MIQELIETKLKEAIPGCQVQVVDLTGTNDHFQVIVVSEKFEGVPLIEQHQMVYAPFKEEMKGPIHAFSVKTMTPAQLERRKGV